MTSDDRPSDDQPPTTYVPSLAPPVTAGTSGAPYAPAGSVADVTHPVPTQTYVPPTNGQVPYVQSRPAPLTPDWFALRRARARKVRRTIRHIDPWSVFKISVLLYLCLYVAALLAGVLLWSAAVGSGLIGNIESFIEELLTFESYKFQGDEIFRGFAIIGLVLAAAGAAFNVVMAILFNLISDLTGGVRITVLEEDDAVPWAQPAPRPRHEARPKKVRQPARVKAAKRAAPPPIPDQAVSPPVTPPQPSPVVSPPVSEPEARPDRVTNQSPVS
jgi:Transmembrane domain of unknown function (DUF3566)